MIAAASTAPVSLPPMSFPAPAASAQPAALRDPARLGAIASHDLLAPQLADSLQTLVDRAAERLRMPIALVSVVMAEAQHFAAARGLPDWVAEAGGTPIEWSFCRHAVTSGEPFLVEDARVEPRIGENPLVELEHVRSYAGVPLVTPDGHTVGAVCVLDTTPRTFSDDDVAALRACAGEVMAAVCARAGTPAA